MDYSKKMDIPTELLEKTRGISEEARGKVKSIDEHTLSRHLPHY